MLRLIVIALWLVPIHGALSADMVSIAIFGNGNSDCATSYNAVLQEEKARPQNAEPTSYYTRYYFGYVNYADGFLSGLNFAPEAKDGNSSAGLGTSGAARMLWLKDYCKDHPMEQFYIAVLALRKYLTQ